MGRAKDGPQGEASLRQWLEAAVRKPTDAHWAELRERGLVRQALASGTEADRRTLADWAEFLAYRSRNRVEVPLKERRATTRKLRRKPTPPVTSSIPDAEIERVRVFSRYLASVAEHDPALAYVRRRLLSGRTLSEEEALALCGSVVARFWSVEDFASRGIPLLEHTSRFFIPNVPEERQPSIFREDTAIEVNGGEGGRHLIEDAWNPYEQAWTEGNRFVLLERLRRRLLSVLPDRVLKGSVFDEIRAVGEHLAWNFRWDEADAQWFVLTGEPPAIDAVAASHQVMQAKDYVHSWIELRIQPWLSPKAVEHAYREVQASVYGRQSKPLSMKVLALVEFVWEKQKVGKVTWEEILQAWNAHVRTDHSDWEYSGYRALRSEYTRVMREIAFNGERTRV
jgi:hypothetical protein